MTEEEAKTKWCPAARVMSDDARSNAAGNRWQTDHDDIPNLFPAHNACIGSACMAWRDTTFTDTVYTEPSSSDPGVRYEKKAGGYCGLASKP